MRYATYHMQLLVRTRHSRKFIGKRLGESKVLHMKGNPGFQCVGVVFCGGFGGFSCVARTVVDQIELLE